jgi:hypothetical protein
MTDFTNHTNDQLAEDLIAAIGEAEARAASEPETPANASHLAELRSRLTKAHLQLSLALGAANGGGFVSLSSGDKD